MLVHPAQLTSDCPLTIASPANNWHLLAGQCASVSPLVVHSSFSNADVRWLFQAAHL